MNYRQAMDLHKSGAAQSSSTTHLYLANTCTVGHGLEVRDGMVWRWGEERSLFWNSRSSFFGGNVLLE